MSDDLKQHIAVLRYFNRWRLGIEKHKQDAREVGIAIDTVCDAVDELLEAADHLKAVIDERDALQRELAAVTEERDALHFAISCAKGELLHERRPSQTLKTVIEILSRQRVAGFPDFQACRGIMTENNALRADKERLDWLQTQCVAWISRGGATGFTYGVKCDGNQTVRRAIDTAKGGSRE